MRKPIYKMFLCGILALIMFFSVSPKYIVFAEADAYKCIIEEYYECINDGVPSEIQDLYGETINSFVKNFFEDADNEENHEGIYNVKNVAVLLMEEVDSLKIYEMESASNVKKYFVKCDMDVYTTDEFYQDGINYFMFWIGNDESGEMKIFNIEIPSHNELKEYDSNTDDVSKFVQIRNELIYGIVTPYATDRPAYIDSVANPNNIKVEGYSNPIPFWDYIEGVAANEINTLSTDSAARAGAMAIKMYTLHFVNTAAYGANYHITQAVQVYNPNTTISTKAANAVEFVKDYFMLGEYGENFKAFYYTAYDSTATVGRYAYQNGGVLSHRETESLGKSGYSWQDILEYYYVKKSGTTYFPNAKESAGVIFTTAHNHDWSNASYCPYCGAEVYFK